MSNFDQDTISTVQMKQQYKYKKQSKGQDHQIITLNNVSNVFAKFEFQDETIHMLKAYTSVLCWVREFICKLDLVCHKIYYNSF